MDDADRKEYGARRSGSDQRGLKSQPSSATSNVGGSEVDPRPPPISDEIQEEEDGESTKDSIQEMVKRRPWMSVIVLIMRQSYVLSLITMMVSMDVLYSNMYMLS